MSLLLEGLYVTETGKRSLHKAISWRVIGTLGTGLFVYILTGHVLMAILAGGFEAILRTFGFWAHEKVWSKLKLGNVQIPPSIVWFTGLPCSGKTTLAAALAKKLTRMGLKVEHLDGDRVRDLLGAHGFDKMDREAHLKRIGLMASLLEKNGVIVIASFVSPYNETRNFVRKLCNGFVEVYLSTPLSECEARDVKGHYAKARRGEIRQFTGVDDPYEIPAKPEMIIDTSTTSIDESTRRIINHLKSVRNAAKQSVSSPGQVHWDQVLFPETP